MYSISGTDIPGHVNLPFRRKTPPLVVHSLRGKFSEVGHLLCGDRFSIQFYNSFVFTYIKVGTLASDY